MEEKSEWESVGVDWEEIRMSNGFGTIILHAVLECKEP